MNRDKQPLAALALFAVAAFIGLLLLAWLLIAAVVYVSGALGTGATIILLVLLVGVIFTI